MNVRIIVAAFCVGLAACGSNDLAPGLTRVDRIEVVDFRNGESNSKAKAVTDAQAIANVVKVIQGVDANWVSGDFTSPSSEIMLVFYRGPEVTARIGLIPGTLVFYGNPGWRWKKISSEAEAELYRYANLPKK